MQDGIVGYATGTEINISNSCNRKEISLKNEAIGGIIGYTEVTKMAINNCSNEGAITAGGHAAGIVGCIKTGETTITSSHNIAIITGGYPTGGIVGLSQDITTINDCYNSGEVTSTGAYAGGIIGGAINNVTINRCYNSNTINTSNGNTVAGIVATCYGTTSIADCYNTGKINVSGKVSDVRRGGIVGIHDSGSSSITLTRCYNASIIATEGYGDVKGAYILGYKNSASSSDFTNVFYIKLPAKYSFASSTSVGKSKTEEEMKTDAFLEELKGSANNTAWKRDPNKNNGMPILSWQ